MSVQVIIVAEREEAKQLLGELSSIGGSLLAMRAADNVAEALQMDAASPTDLIVLDARGDHGELLVKEARVRFSDAALAAVTDRDTADARRRETELFLQAGARYVLTRSHLVTDMLKTLAAMAAERTRMSAALRRVRAGDGAAQDALLGAREPRQHGVSGLSAQMSRFDRLDRFDPLDQVASMERTTPSAASVQTKQATPELDDAENASSGDDAQRGQATRAGEPPAAALPDAMSEARRHSDEPAPLKERAPDYFEQRARRFLDLMELSMERQMYRVDHNIGPSLKGLAEEMSQRLAGPRDLVTLYTDALAMKRRGVAPSQYKAYAHEGRLLLLEMMGYLVSCYRRWRLEGLAAETRRAGDSPTPAASAAHNDAHNDAHAGGHGEQQ